jgi:hypothetical protein
MSLRTRAELMEVFKILKGFAGIEEQLFFRRHISSTIGHSMKLYKDRVSNYLPIEYLNCGIDYQKKLLVPIV